jgi:hypothetical protein
MVLSLMSSSLLAAGVSRLLSKPLYGELARMLPIPERLPDEPVPPPRAVVQGGH